MRYLLDTNFCIYIIKRRPPEVLHRLESLPQGSAVMSVVTLICCSEVGGGCKVTIQSF